MKFLATLNTPGYSPWDDDPPTFDTARAAWEYLADERIRQEDSALDTDVGPAILEASTYGGYSSIVNTMESLGNGTLSFEEHDLCGVCSDGTGTIWGKSPDEKMHDLGINYTVSIVEPCEEGDHVVEVDGTECTVCGQATPEPETFTINERPLTDDTVTWAPAGFKFEGGHTAIVTYHTYQSPNSDEVHRQGFATNADAERFIIRRYGKTSDDLIHGGGE